MSRYRLALVALLLCLTTAACTAGAYRPSPTDPPAPIHEDSGGGGGGGSM